MRLLLYKCRIHKKYIRIEVPSIRQRGSQDLDEMTYFADATPYVHSHRRSLGCRPDSAAHHVRGGLADRGIDDRGAAAILLARADGGVSEADRGAGQGAGQLDDRVEPR